MNFIKKMLNNYKNYLEYRHNYLELSNLSERELRDIGISRCDIKHVAKGEIF